MNEAPQLHDPHLYTTDFLPIFRRLRAESPVYWHPTPGFWMVSRHEDVVAVSRDPERFCSSRGVLLSDLQRPIIPRQSIVYIDPPEHAQYRKLVQPAFTPGRLRDLHGRIEGLVAELAEGLGAGTAVDFVEQFAAPLPMLVIAEMLGVPGADRERFKRWSDAIIDAGTQPNDDSMAQSLELLDYFRLVIAERRKNPGNDLVSALVHSKIEGQQLEEFDLLMFCMTLLVAGNETTRNLLAHGAAALATYADQRAKLASHPELMPRAVEEMLRWASPIMSFMRTATRETQLRDQTIREGDRLILNYLSANRDEALFGNDADDLDVTRDASAHVAFGFGEHFCLGAQLARMEARLAFAHLVGKFARWEIGGEIERLPSAFVHGIVRLPLVLS